MKKLSIILKGIWRRCYYPLVAILVILLVCVGLAVADSQFVRYVPFEVVVEEGAKDIVVYSMPDGSVIVGVKLYIDRGLEHTVTLAVENTGAETLELNVEAGMLVDNVFTPGVPWADVTVYPYHLGVLSPGELAPFDVEVSVPADRLLDTYWLWIRIGE